MAKEKVPQYLLDFPSEEYRDTLKIFCVANKISMKDFIIQAITEKRVKYEDEKWGD